MMKTPRVCGSMLPSACVLGLSILIACTSASPTALPALTETPEQRTATGAPTGTAKSRTTATEEPTDTTTPKPTATPKPTHTATTRPTDTATPSPTPTATVTPSADLRAAYVSFINNTRNADRVVSARDETRALSGGIKQLEVRVSPAGRLATLTIRRVQGASGSAIFEKTGSPTMTVTGEQIVTIIGRDVSDHPRNMAIEARVGEVLKDSWLFTVFRVDPTAFDSGNIHNVLPATALTHAGRGSETLVEMYKRKTKKNTALGHRHVSVIFAYGGIVISGRIVPSGIDRKDFNLDYSRSDAFNWDRRITERAYDGYGCLLQKKSAAKDDRSDDVTELEEDLFPDSDGIAGELFIWVTDMPFETLTGGFRNGQEGDIRRVRVQFIERAYYAGVPVSDEVPWYWRTSLQLGAQGFVQNDDYPGDNQVAGFAVTPLTPDLGPSTIPDFTLTKFSPPSVEWGHYYRAEVTGTGLDSGAPCDPVVQLIYESYTNWDQIRVVIVFNSGRVTDSSILGNFDVPDIGHPGPYTLKVFIGDQVRSLPEAVTIEEP